MKETKIKMRKMQNNKNGITLIALVITIIVLLILAGVTIATLTGENGILKQAESAKSATEEAEEQEKADLEEQNKLIENRINIANNTLPQTEDTSPFLPTGAIVTNADLSTGVTIRDAKGNEWVWIEVPKSIYTNEEYNEGTAPTSSEDYAKIESVMQKYAKDYRNEGYADTWYSEAQHGFATATDYNNHKNSMLKSVYENGGFYIGKYEVGIKEDTYRNFGTDYNTEHEITQIPVIQEDKYVYNWVTCKQAQELSKSLATGGKASSLMFGIQWDLVLKHIEVKGEKIQTELKSDSTTWGNYINATFNIEKGQYSKDYGETYNLISGTYTKVADDNVLLTTGVTERNSILNIYDLAGNVWEWTLEYTSDAGDSCSLRGGYYSDYGNIFPVSDRRYGSTTGNNYRGGYRPSLW